MKRIVSIGLTVARRLTWFVVIMKSATKFDNGVIAIVVVVTTGDAIMMFVADICGEASEEDNPPKQACVFGDLGRLHKQMYEERVAAPKAFHSQVTAKNFPYPEQNITMHPNEKENFLEAQDKTSRPSARFGLFKGSKGLILSVQKPFHPVHYRPIGCCSGASRQAD
ncbi:MAG: hypothetical protein EP300_13175 [Gammaproteobacteria bacterium]|nr:MAG: hypothetical protein EP300_13175 [Gammaproteobacteria bacterium]